MKRKTNSVDVESVNWQQKFIDLLLLHGFVTEHASTSYAETPTYILKKTSVDLSTIYAIVDIKQKAKHNVIQNIIFYLYKRRL